MKSGCSASTCTGATSRAVLGQEPLVKSTSWGFSGRPPEARRRNQTMWRMSRPGVASSMSALELHRLSAANADVAGDDDLGPGIHDAVAQRAHAEAGVNHRMDRAEARHGQHGGDPLAG